MNIRILHYSVNGLGLGHVTRQLAIAESERKLCPNAEIVFLTSSEAENIIYQENFAAFKVPSKTIRESTNLRRSTYAKMVQTITWNAISAFNPHILIVDTFPAGTLQELLPILRWNIFKVFIFRTLKPEIACDPYLQNTLLNYHLIIIPHCENEVEIPLPSEVQSIWTGPIMIRDNSSLLNPEEIKTKLNLPKDKTLIYTTFGGGGDGTFFSSLEIIEKVVSKNKNLHLVVAPGPLYRGSFFNKDNISRINWYPIVETFPAYNLAISSAGYNTTNELLHNGIPTIFIPLERTLDDQRARAKRIAEKGAGLMLETLTEENLQSALKELSEENFRKKISGQAKKLVLENGAEKAAKAILKLVDWKEGN